MKRQRTESELDALVEMTRNEAKPAPVALTAEMLGEEDREMIAELREGCGMLDHNGWLDDAIAWADRLLNQGEG